MTGETQGARRLTFQIGDETVSALIMIPAQAHALFVFAHGAGANMEHAFMQAMSEALASRGIATLRYNFPYMEHRRGRPDRKPVLHATVRAAVELAHEQMPGLPMIAGGKSMGGRMTSEAQAAEPLPEVQGLVFVGFPLHPPKRPSTERADHLARVRIPMLFLQGTRDDLAQLDLIRGVTSELGERATLHIAEGADHSFHVLKRSGRSDEEVMEELAQAVARFAR